MILLSAIALCALNVNATIIVSGDASIASALNPAVPTFYNQGDQQFFTNILGNATDVAVFDQLGTNPFAFQINNYYSSVSAINTSEIPTISSSSLENVGMLIVPLPVSAFSNDEMAIMNSYINGGGSVFFLGDAFTSSVKNAIINQMLLGIGSSLSIKNDSLDRGINKATANQISPDVYTNGVQSLTYGFVSAVNSGTSLFSTKNGTSFIAYEPTSVPEPSMAMLIIVSIVGFLGLKKRNRK